MRRALFAAIAAASIILGLATPASAAPIIEAIPSAPSGVVTCALDYSWAKPSLSQAAQVCPVVLRYIDKQGVSSKNITASELAQIQQAGLGLGLVFERYAERAKAGYSAGQYDAQRVNTGLAQLGLPLDTVVYVAIDFDANWQQVWSYMDGWNSVRAPEVTGVYGSIRIVNFMRGVYLNTTGHGTRANYGWATYAWRNGYAWPDGTVAQIRQVSNNQSIAGGTVDYNYIMNGTWGGVGQGSTAAAPPQVTADGVPTLLGTTKYGSRGAAVTALQGRLYDRGWRITVDGVFGAQTRAIVIKFQTEKGLTVDGIAGPQTWACAWTCSL